MSDPQNAAEQRIPVTVLTGFLGSGKTTLLNKLLRRPELADTAVIINEFGEIGLDHLLVEKSDDEGMVTLNSGCLCCTVRGDLVRTMSELFLKRSRGEVSNGCIRVSDDVLDLLWHRVPAGTLVLIT